MTAVEKDRLRKSDDVYLDEYNLEKKSLTGFLQCRARKTKCTTVNEKWLGILFYLTDTNTNELLFEK